MATRVQIVVTPGSGSGGALTTARGVCQGLAAQGYTPSVRTFRTLGELDRWAKTCDATFSHLIAVGGDATVSTAAGAAVRLSVPLVPVPSGFGNLFASAFEHPHEPEEVVDLLGQGDHLCADVGIARDGMFLSHQSYGILARIQEAVERLRRHPRQRYRRLLSYCRMALKHLSEAPLDAIRVEVDGHPVPGRAALVTIANVETYRGFLSLTPAASPMDGLFDVCVIPRTTRTRLLAQLIKLMLDVPGCRAEIGLYRGRNVRVNRRKPNDARILDGALPLLVPVGSLERLRARQIATEADVSLITPAPRERVASVREPAGAPGRPARSRRPAGVGGGG